MTDKLEHNTKNRNETRIPSFILKGSSGGGEVDFCSEEDDLEMEDEIHSPTDASEDSVEVKVTPISSRNKNKRKCAEPRKVPNDEVPLKKRIRFEMKQDSSSTGRTSPFRPWSVPSRSTTCASPPPGSFHPVYGYQDEPLSLVKIKVPDDRVIPRVPPHPGVRPPTLNELEEQKTQGFSVDSLLSPKAGSSKQDKPQTQKEQKEQRNYKNMTRERRIEANARERTRVHTISAAFDTLRRAIPAYSHNQKLSKLSVLRIACSYILTLSRVAGADYSADQSAPSLANCVDLVSRTIQTEGRIRKKKDE